MNEIMFSIVVPVYNVENYLHECVRSLLNQSYDNFEVILVDDGSTDNSGIICEEYKNNDSRVTTYHKKNGGLSDARNFGIEKAVGKYMCFVDSDDYVATDMLYRYVECIMQYPELDVILEPGQYTITNDKVLNVKKYCGGKEFGCVSGQEAFSKVLTHTMWAAFGKLFRRDFWMNNQFEFRVGIMSEDLDLIYKVLYKAKYVVMTDEYSYYYRNKREGSIMSTFGYQNIVDMLDIYDRWEDFFKENNITDINKAKMQNCLSESFSEYVLPAIYTLACKNKNDILFRCEKYVAYFGYKKKIMYLIGKIFGVNILCGYCYGRRRCLNSILVINIKRFISRRCTL